MKIAAQMAVRGLFVFGVFLTLAGLASASCVSQDDLVKGITIEFNDGSIETHRQNSRGEVIVQMAKPNGTIDRWTLANGIYYVAHEILRNGKPQKNSGYVVDYGLSHSALPIPDDEGKWETRSTLELPLDSPLRQREVFLYGSPETVRVNGCSYEVIPIESTTTVQGDVDIVGMLFLSQLGTSLTVELNGEPWREPVSLAPMQSD